MPQSVKRIYPFWCYYGGKFRLAPKYPQPLHDTIIEPFAGAAGYSMRYYSANIVLYDIYPLIVETWDFLIRATTQDILRLPIVEHVDEIPDRFCRGAKTFIGWRMNYGTQSPRKSLSKRLKELNSRGCPRSGWNEVIREFISFQVNLIKHWKIYLGDYTDIPSQRATWFIDPPYNNRMGKYYVHSNINYRHLASWVCSRQGQVICCENVGARWLPFKPFANAKSQVAAKRNMEAIYYRENN